MLCGIFKGVFIEPGKKNARITGVQKFRAADHLPLRIGKIDHGSGADIAVFRHREDGLIEHLCGMVLKRSLHVSLHRELIADAAEIHLGDVQDAAVSGNADRVDHIDLRGEFRKRLHIFRTADQPHACPDRLRVIAADPGITEAQFQVFHDLLRPLIGHSVEIEHEDVIAPSADPGFLTECLQEVADNLSDQFGVDLILAGGLVRIRQMQEDQLESDLAGDVEIRHAQKGISRDDAVALILDLIRILHQAVDHNHHQSADEIADHKSRIQILNQNPAEGGEDKDENQPAVLLTDQLAVAERYIENLNQVVESDQHL